MHFTMHCTTQYYLLAIGGAYLRPVGSIWIFLAKAESASIYVYWKCCLHSIISQQPTMLRKSWRLKLCPDYCILQKLCGLLHKFCGKICSHLPHTGGILLLLTNKSNTFSSYRKYLYFNIQIAHKNLFQHISWGPGRQGSTLSLGGI